MQVCKCQIALFRVSYGGWALCRINCTIPNSELGYYVLSQILGWDIMYYLEYCAGMFCTIPWYVLVYSEPRFGDRAAQDLSPLGPCRALAPVRFSSSGKNQGKLRTTQPQLTPAQDERTKKEISCAQIRRRQPGCFYLTQPSAYYWWCLGRCELR